ncbi:DUF4352 domain-containing protein [Sphaerisporangium fuscum]|uniref:DUF4352 domain-containing protein n=1 Tax=Sphaerisporangium fuscum TaxID=2835868 RepID=UPI001BDD400F|nr:DUF4352 domain-containing protein [Sphaerisporangium fuscum]
MRLDERALHVKPVVDGDTRFSLLGITVAMPQLTGSHADVAAKGQFVRIRVSAVNNGRTSALLDLRKQQLLATDGKTYLPDYDAMTIKRQPEKIDLGASDLFEFDLWYDIPKQARPTALVLYGGATLTDLKDLEGARAELPG